MKPKDIRTFYACAIVLCLSLFPFSAFAGSFPAPEGNPCKAAGMKPHRMSPCGLWQDPKVAQALGLTAEQLKRLRDADFVFKERRLELKFQLDRVHLQMAKAFSAESVDEAAVRELAQKIAGLTGNLFIQHIESHLAVGKILTAEQRQKLKTLEWSARPRGMGPPAGAPMRGPCHPW